MCFSWHSSVVLSDTKFLIHGGYNGNNALSDTFIFDIGERSLPTNTHAHTMWRLGRSPGHILMSINDFGLCFTGSDTSSWTEVRLPQLSVPRAGHSIITMETAGHLRFLDESEDAGADGGAVSRTLLVFGGGDNEGNFYSDLTTVAVEEVLAAI